MLGGKKTRFYTFGCQMNVYDSEQMLRDLAAAGYVETHNDDEADIFVLNTCSVRDKPEQKVYSLLGRLKRHKAARGAMIVVAGCVAQQEREALAERAPFVDVVMGPDHTGEIIELLEQAARRGKVAIATHPTSGDVAQPLARDEIENRKSKIENRCRASAFVTVMKGCNQFCSYCIVPYTRGREVSKGVEEVLHEVRCLVESGVKEITLLGQNVNRYGMDRAGLPRFNELLDMVHAVDGLRRLRFITSHPADCTDELIDCFLRLDRLCPYFHLPLQSGSDRVLAAMNRRYEYARYLDRVKRLRAVRPDIHISTDLIVGFPGETDEDFAATLAAAHEVQWGSAFSFKYSPRPGTAAAGLADDVPETEKKRRLEILQSALYHYACVAMERHAGSVEEVLVEGTSSRPPKGEGRQFTGRTKTNYVVNFDASERAGDLRGALVEVLITQVLPHSLVGKPAREGWQHGN